MTVARRKLTSKAAENGAKGVTMSTAPFRRRAAAFAGAAAAFAAGAVATAQDDDAGAERLRASAKERALTIPRENPPEIGAPARDGADGEINWIEMKTQLAISARRDISSQQATTRVVARPPGMRATSADRFKTVRAVEINRAQVPVLVPEGEGVAATLKVYAQGDSYSATAEVAEGVAMRMSGAKRKLVLGDAKAAREKFAAMRRQQQTLASVSAPYLITRSDSATDLSFAKFGAGYVLSVTCDEPETDARCLDDDFIVGLASNLMLLNPEAGGE